MAVSNYRALQAFTAGANLSAAYGLGVIIDSSIPHGVKLPTSAGSAITGVVIEPAPQGKTVGVCVEYASKVPVRVSAAVAKGAQLAVGTDGRFATVGSSGGTVVGIALEAATAENQVITMLLGAEPAVVAAAQSAGGGSDAGGTGAGG